MLHANGGGHYRLLEIIWVLGSGPGSSAIVASALSQRAMSQVTTLVIISLLPTIYFSFLLNLESETFHDSPRCVIRLHSQGPKVLYTWF